ncbi:protein DGS1, mitochondrial [Artemisia annua]|uniref:Protein DGS1, mitochondrial n=1 Tax=Artemisia annua TaxID=35608 RepID=A0A2U1M5L4_ARTAN|nr:protein DGS1, mitochondrial [Artemisia annua]
MVCEAHESDVDIGIPAVMLPHDDVASLIIREEYHLTAKDGNLHSKVMVHPVYSVLQDILNRTFLNLYALDQALLRWDPSGAIEPISASDELRLTNDVPEPQTFGTSLRLDHIADAEIAHKIRMLYRLRYSLAVFLSQLYVEIDKFGKTMTPNSDKPFGTLLITTDDYFSKLEASICFYSKPLSFDKLADYRKLWPNVNTWDEKWSDDNTEEAITVFNENLNKLDMYISMMYNVYVSYLYALEDTIC